MNINSKIAIGLDLATSCTVVYVATKDSNGEVSETLLRDNGLVNFFRTVVTISLKEITLQEVQQKYQPAHHGIFYYQIGDVYYKIIATCGDQGVIESQANPEASVKYFKSLTDCEERPTAEMLSSKNYKVIQEGNKFYLQFKPLAILINGSSKVETIKLSIFAVWVNFVYYTLSNGLKDYIPSDQNIVEYFSKNQTPIVITVPAYFGNYARELIKSVAETLGLKVLRVINEPTAAMIGYCEDKEFTSITSKIKSEFEPVIVCDLGGGTFDVSVIQTESIESENGKKDTVFQVCSTFGDHFLGGQNFTMDGIYSFVKDYFTARKPSALGNIPFEAILEDRSVLFQVMSECEKVRVALSAQETATFNLNIFSYTYNGQSYSTSLKLLCSIKREDYIKRCDHLMGKIRECIFKSLDKAYDQQNSRSLTSPIKYLLCVGGMLNTPFVKDAMVSYVEEYNRSKFRDSQPQSVTVMINKFLLDNAVGKGAVTLCTRLSNFSEGSESITLLDVTAVGFAIESAGGIATQMIPANTPIPVTKTQEFSTGADNQTSAVINICEGDRPLYKDNRQLGSFTLTGIPPAPRGTPRIEVTYYIDANGILTVTATEGKSNRQQITITNGSKDKRDIEEMKKAAAQFAESDRKAKELVETNLRLDSAVYSLSQSLTQYKDKISQELAEKLNKLQVEATDFLNKNKNATYSEQLISQYEDLIKQINSTMQQIGLEINKAGSSPQENAQSSAAAQDVN